MIISGHWDRKIRFWDIRGGGTNELGAGVAVNELAIQGRVTSLSLFSSTFAYVVFIHVQLYMHLLKSAIMTKSQS